MLITWRSSTLNLEQEENEDNIYEDIFTDAKMRYSVSMGWNNEIMLWTCWHQYAQSQLNITVLKAEYSGIIRSIP